MNSNRPYLLRALYEWIVDNECTPYLLVECNVPGVVVPNEHIQEGKIVLNISPMAVRQLSMGNEFIEFDGRFSGRSMWISVPVGAVLAIYAKENNAGMGFEVALEAAESGSSVEGVSGPGQDQTDTEALTQPAAKPSASHLKLVD